MTIQEIHKLYNRIIGLLDRKEIKNAFEYIQTLIAGTNEYTFQNRLDKVQDTYKYMLQYRMQGAKDPMQETIYTNLQATSYELADSIRNKVLTKESSTVYYNMRREWQQKEEKTYQQLQTELDLYQSTQNNIEFDKALNTLFTKIWTSDLLKKDEYEVIKEILVDKNLSFICGAQIVSALLLALQMSFDKEKIELLFDAAAIPDKNVSIRVLIGILLTLYIYRKRTDLYPTIQQRLTLLAESPGFTKAVQTIILRFILARETEKITRKLQEEIIPEMMKLSPKISKKFNINDLRPEQLPEEMNPEWEKMLSNSQLGKKMEELSELQQEGADVMHSTFVHLKNFPFFRELGNWFLPFTSQHSLFGGRFQTDNKEKQILDTITRASFMCNSDKYSLYFSMMQLPEQHRQMIMGQFDSQASEMIQQNKEELVSKRGEVEIISGQYIQDLYRFYKLYPRHLDFMDIFNLPLDFHNLSILEPYISDKESLTAIAEYYLRKNYFQDALTVFERLAGNDRKNEYLYQKIGYCYQMLGKLEAALKNYLYADLLNPESKWVIRRIAGCYRSLKNPQEALTYYHRYETLAPNDLSIQISIGHCLLELKEYNEALKYFFKVDYLDDKKHRAWRPIAWCSFLIGKFDQARNYYKKILETSPDWQDYLNAGHTEWALQNIKGAIEYYKKAIERAGDFNKFLENFNQDENDLLIAGIEKEEIPLMLDQLRYELN